MGGIESLPENQTGGSAKCPAGKIRRVGYKTKKGAKIKSTCVLNRGKPGKTPKAERVLPKPKDNHFLTKFGYKLNNPVSKRKTALNKAIKKYGALAVERHIVLIMNYMKSEKTQHTKLKRDFEYAKKMRLSGK